MSVKITGLQATLNKMKKYREDTINEIKEVLADTATDIEISAIRSAPMFIKNKIDKLVADNGLTWTVGVQGNDPLPAYFEFGTGLSAREILGPYPDWVKDIARQFYVNGQGTLRGQPFLYPAVLKAQAQFEKDLKEVLSKETEI